MRDLAVMTVQQLPILLTHCMAASTRCVSTARGCIEFCRQVFVGSSCVRAPHMHDSDYCNHPIHNSFSFFLLMCQSTYAFFVSQERLTFLLSPSTTDSASMMQRSEQASPIDAMPQSCRFKSLTTHISTIPPAFTASAAEALTT